MPYQVNDSRLATLYSRSPRSVAYIDESYRLTGSEKYFYIISAVVVNGDAIEQTRQALLDTVGGDYWHTTEAMKSEDGKRTLGLLTQALADDDAVKLCTLEAREGAFEDPEKVRRYTMVSMMKLLAEHHDVDLVVYERRREGDEENFDRATERGLQGFKMTKDIRMHGGTPTSEPLLWAPDIVAGTLRRRLALRQDEWFEPLRSKTSIFRAEDHDPIILQGK